MPMSLASAPSSRPPSASPQLAAFVQALRAGLHDGLRAALDAAAEALDQAQARTLTPIERARLCDLQSPLRSRRTAWMPRLLQSLEEALDEELGERRIEAHGAEAPERALTLLDEESIDEDIALSRLVQVAEIEAEGALRELAARCTRLRGWEYVQPDAHPMRPAVVARALRRGVGTLDLAAPSRLALLRQLAPAVGNQLAPLYARQLALLEQWSIEPERFGMRASSPSPSSFAALAAAGAGPGPDPGPGAGGPGSAVERGLGEGPLSTALIRSPSTEGAARRLAEHALHRLALGASASASAGDPASPSGALDPVQTMARLLTALIGRAATGGGARRALQRLEAPARRLAQTEPEVWRSPDHPLWLLLDRLLQSGPLLDEEDLDGNTLSGNALDAALTRLEQEDPPDPEQLRLALQAVDGASQAQLQAQAQRLAPQAEHMQQHVAREEIEARVRELVVQQVHARGLPPALHQFLVGPWTTALAASAERHGLDSAQFAMQAELIDTFVATCTRPRKQPLDSATFTRCLTHARLALVDAGLPAARVEAELADLGRTMRRPWHEARETLPAFDEAATGRSAPAGPSNALADLIPESPGAAEATAAPPASEPLALHEALATVALELGGGAEASARLSAACEAWVGALEPGTLCRLFIQGRWCTLQLVWRSLDRSMFVLTSRQADAKHTLTRSTLHKLRGAGLAASIERGQFIAHALDELAQASI